VTVLAVRCSLVAETSGRKVDVVLGVELERFERQQVGVGLALQPRLAERRALVGRHRLIADQGDRPGVAVLAQQRRGRAAGVSCPHDHHPCVAHGSPIA
jgi:hypothetical protein